MTVGAAERALPSDLPVVALFESDKQDEDSSSPGNKLDQSWDILLKLSESKNLQHRKFAIAGYALLAEQSSRGRKRAIEMLAGDNDSELRTFAASALGEERCRRAIPALKRSLNDASTDVAFAAAKALADMNNGAGNVVFREVLLGERKDSQSMISGYLEDAREKMHDPRALAIIGVNQAVGSFFGPAGMLLSMAEKNLKDKGAPGRALAASALAGDRSTAARQALESALQDSNSSVRGSACRSLAVLGYRSAIPFIEPLLDDKDEASRGMAAAAYIRLRMARAS
ncbi:MAG TPA: HEAT repeat domain-containing protein [Bryobacteraceae bacterium]|nr:HEAT repeat domain-containing protein [Bryobacteraceae bacterium]